MAINKDKIRAAAQKYLQKGQIDKAIREYERLVEDDPKDVRTLLKLGDLQTRAGQNPEATKTYAKVAGFYSEQGFFLKAVAVYKQILKLDPALIDVNVKLAELYHQLGLLSDASNQYRQLSQLLEQQGRVQESIDVLKKMVELDPENVASRIKLAEIYAKQNMPELARTEFTRAAAFLKQHHRIDDYVKVAERIVFFDPEDLETTRELANLYIQKGDARRALAKLQVCFKANPKDVETLTLLASAFKDLGQSQKTLSVYRELSRIYKDTGDDAKHQAVMGKILDLAPDDAEAQAAVGGGDEAKRSALARIVPAQRPMATAAAPAAEVREIDRRPAPEPEIEEEVEFEEAEALGSDEPAAAPEPVDEAAEAVSRLLVETEIYVKYGLRNKAIEHLRKIFALDADHRDASEKHKHLLIEAGDTRGAVEQLWRMAQAAHGKRDDARAQDDLEELLGIEPGHREARALLQEIAPEAAALGGQAPEPEADEFDVETTGADEVPSLTLEGAAGGVNLSYEPSAEAASIDLDEEGEELAIDEELGTAQHDDDGGEVTVGFDDEVVDEPAAPVAKPVVPAPVVAAKPVPAPTPMAATPTSSKAAKPVDDELDALLASAVPTRAKAAPPVPAPAKPMAASPTPTPKPMAAAPIAAKPAPVAPVAKPAPVAPVAKPAPAATVAKPAPAPVVAAKPAPAPPPVDEGPADLTDEIEEVHFYLQQGLEDEARDALDNLLETHPTHPELLALKVQLSSAAEAAQAPSIEAEPEPEFESLQSELAEEMDEAAGDDQTSFNDVFDEFKKGVEKAVDASDYETHYNLGIAYKEMGLIDDAIREFNQSRGSPEREVTAITMIGLCQLERSDTHAALQAFLEGLNSQRVTAVEAVALRYEIGSAYETMGRGADALKFFEKAQSMDPQFRDVAQRVSELRQREGDVSTSDELDELLNETAAEKAALEQKGGGKISYL